MQQRRTLLTWLDNWHKVSGVVNYSVNWTIDAAHADASIAGRARLHLICWFKDFIAQNFTSYTVYANSKKTFSRLARL